ncbi:MAG TPA: diguanylate cyclase [Noviherbaspirillum sp.]|nr:diguanylate cyclase [Noviherbaspirillum sp.]
MNAKSSDKLPNIVDLLLDAVFLVDAEGCIVYASAACERIFGYTPDEMTGKKLIDLIVPEDRARTAEEAALVMTGQSRVGFENRYIRKDGSMVHIMWSARWSEADQLRIGVARDVTDRKRAEDMQTAIYAISEAAHSASDLVHMLREIQRIIGRLVPASGFAVTLRDSKGGQFFQPYQADMSTDATARKLLTEVVRTRRTVLEDGEALADGRKESWIGLPLVLPTGVIGALILKSHPGTRYSEKDKELLQFVSTQVATALERRRLNEELLRAARYDELTGLPNRRLFQDRMRSALARTRRHVERIALLYVDIDDFKQINDSLGHAAGDQLLAEVAHRLQQCVREEDTVARVGGDEFVVLLEEIQEPEDAQLVADKITATISQPVHQDGQLLCVQPSIGIALYPDDGASADELLKHADMKMYESKKLKVPGA